MLVIGFLFIRFRSISASELENRGEIKWQISTTEDFNNDGRKENLLVTSYGKGSSHSVYISARDSLLHYREKLLVGFEEDLAFCPMKILDIGGEKAVCVFGEVGAHSQNIQIIKWRNFEAVNFVTQDGKVVSNMLTDVPDFDFNYAKTDKLKIYVDNRDYDSDPLVDIIRTYYYLGNSTFHFDGSEHIGSEGLIK